MAASRTVAQIKQAEHDRLAFIEDRDGYDAMIAYAKQCYGIYRNCRNPKCSTFKKYGQSYRVELIASCVVLRQVIRGAK